MTYSDLFDELIELKIYIYIFTHYPLRKYTWEMASCWASSHPSTEVVPPPSHPLQSPGFSLVSLAGPLFPLAAGEDSLKQNYRV